MLEFGIPFLAPDGMRQCFAVFMCCFSTFRGFEAKTILFQNPEKIQITVMASGTQKNMVTCSRYASVFETVRRNHHASFSRIVLPCLAFILQLEVIYHGG